MTCREYVVKIYIHTPGYNEEDAKIAVDKLINGGQWIEGEVLEVEEQEIGEDKE